MAVTAERLKAGSRDELAATQTKPVLWWAGLGAFFVALQMYVVVGWMLSKDFHHIGTGVTPVPTYMTVAARANEVIWAITVPVAVYFLIYRPFRRDGKLTLTGLFMLAFLFVWWQDPVANAISYYFSYTSVNLNMGGFAGHIPFWSSPNGGSIPPPLFIDISYYFVVCTLLATGAAKFWRYWRARNPRVRTSTMIITTYCLFFPIDFVLEFLWCRLGLIVFPGAISSWSIFPSRFYKFPIYEPLLVAALYTGFAMVRYFTNDRGETVAERGAGELRLGAKQRTLVRYLALVGILNVVFLAIYNVPIQVWALHASTWPKAAQERSYITHGMCGAGTDYACTNSRVAFARKNAVALRPNGTLYVPPGVRLPQVVPLSRERK
jgi:Spirocyclase AveC-like